MARPLPRGRTSPVDDNNDENNELVRGVSGFSAEGLETFPVEVLNDRFESDNGALGYQTIIRYTLRKRLKNVNGFI